MAPVATGDIFTTLRSPNVSLWKIETNANTEPSEAITILGGAYVLATCVPGFQAASTAPVPCPSNFAKLARGSPEAAANAPLTNTSSCASIAIE